tara:strand:- start:261 stop:416 length:156 start_codon:yes stop_codon:yes gene_type:complete
MFFANNKLAWIKSSSRILIVSGVWSLIIFAFYFFYKFEQIWPKLKAIIEGG